MPKIMVHKAFGLLHSPTDKPTRFEEGLHDVSDEVAGHWYTKEHASLVAGDKAAAKAPGPAKPAVDVDASDAERLPVDLAKDAADGPNGSDGGEDAPGAGGETGGQVDSTDASFAEDADAAPDFDAMSEEQLRAFLKQRDGRAPHPKTGLAKLLASAKGNSPQA